MTYAGRAAASDSSGELLQAAWLGLGSQKFIAATSVRVSHTRPSCAKTVRAYLMGIRRPATMKEIHAAANGRYTYEELGSALSKLLKAGAIGRSDRAGAPGGGRVPRDQFVRRYWWAEAAANLAETARTLRRTVINEAASAANTMATVAGSGIEDG